MDETTDPSNLAPVISPTNTEAKTAYDPKELISLADDVQELKATLTKFHYDFTPMQDDEFKLRVTCKDGTLVVMSLGEGNYYTTGIWGGRVSIDSDGIFIINKPKVNLCKPVESFPDPPLPKLPKALSRWHFSKNNGLDVITGITDALGGIDNRVKFAYDYNGFRQEINYVLHIVETEASRLDPESAGFDRRLRAIEHLLAAIEQRLDDDAAKHTRVIGKIATIKQTIQQQKRKFDHSIDSEFDHSIDSEFDHSIDSEDMDETTDPSNLAPVISPTNTEAKTAYDPKELISLADDVQELKATLTKFHYDFTPMQDAKVRRFFPGVFWDILGLNHTKPSHRIGVN
eukprot:27680_1